MAKIFDIDVYEPWKNFRQTEDARFVGLVLPRILLRLPYGKDILPVQSFRYEERVIEHEDYLWGNAAFALGVRLAEAFNRSGWCAAIRGVEGGGLIEGLPSHVFLNDDGDHALKCPTETTITDRRAAELTHLGFIPLLHVKDTATAVFLSVFSCYDPGRFADADHYSSEAVSASLDYAFAVSRFAHYLRCVMRDNIGSCFMSAQQCSDFLNRWIIGYVSADDSANATIQAKYPLRSATVSVDVLPGKPGAFRAVLEIQPRFQFASNIRPLRTTVLLPQAYP